MKIKYLIVFIVISVISGCQSSKCNAVNDQTPVRNFSKLEVVIERVGNLGSYGRPGQIIGMYINVLILNTSQDTVKLAYSLYLDSALFTTDSKNLILTAPWSYSNTARAKMITIKPHEYQWTMLSFNYRKTPQQSFKFKVGFHNLNWSNYQKGTPDDIKQIENAEVLWSDEQTFNINAEHSGDKESIQESKKLAEILSPPLKSLQQNRLSLIIAKDHMIKRKMQVCSMKGTKSFMVPVKLFNNSNDTLEYANMSCDWPTIFVTDNHLINIPAECMCLANYPTNYHVAPHKSITFKMPLDFDATIKPGTHFRLGMVLLDFPNMSHVVNAEFFGYFRFVSGDPKYTLWSNDIEVPQYK